MATTKARLNISLSNETLAALKKLAQRDQMPQATKAAQLLESALELEEDQVWDSLAQQRDNKSALFIPHNKAWE